MKATLEFDLIEDKEKFQCVMDTINDKVPEYKIDQLYCDVFRPILKHGTFKGKELTQTKIDLIEQIWKKVSESLRGEA